MSDVHYRMAERSDLPALCSLINAGHRADDIPQIVELQELTEEVNDAGDMTANVRLALRDAELVGYVRTMHLPSDERLERCYLIGSVHPDERGRGIGRALMAWAIDRGTAQLQSSNSALNKYLRVDLHDSATTARRLFDRLGFREIRQFEELLRPLTDLPPFRDPAASAVTSSNRSSPSTKTTESSRTRSITALRPMTRFLGDEMVGSTTWARCLSGVGGASPQPSLFVPCTHSRRRDSRTLSSVSTRTALPGRFACTSRLESSHIGRIPRWRWHSPDALS